MLCRKSRPDFIIVAILILFFIMGFEVFKESYLAIFFLGRVEDFWAHSAYSMSFV